MKMGLREANQNFSKAIKAVKAGKVVVLTERGKPIATIKPIEEENDDTIMQRLVDEGFIKPAANPGPLWDDGWKPLKVPGTPLSEVLRKLRDED